jgi:hypothetical protein
VFFDKRQKNIFFKEYAHKNSRSKSSENINILIENFLQRPDWHLVTLQSKKTFKIFIAKELVNVKRNFLYEQKDPNNFKPKVNIIPRLNKANIISDADFILVPHPWVKIKNNYEYRRYLIKLSKFCPLLIANSDDLSPKCDLPNTIQLRSFLHPRENGYRKIIFPYPIRSQDFMVREWKSIPCISFIGFVPALSLGSLTSKSKSFLYAPIQSSVYINRKIATKKLQNLHKQFKVIVQPKSTFALLSENMNIDYDVKQYKKNLLESDYILCPRGFGNVSMRFYETLNSGATPLLIESGSQLPRIDNNSFWQKNIISLKLFSNWAETIWKDWASLRLSDNYSIRQLQNREISQSQLDFQKFSEKILKNYLSTS